MVHLDLKDRRQVVLIRGVPGLCSSHLPSARRQAQPGQARDGDSSDMEVSKRSGLPMTLVYCGGLNIKQATNFQLKITPGTHASGTHASYKCDANSLFTAVVVLLTSRRLPTFN